MHGTVGSSALFLFPQPVGCGHTALFFAVAVFVFPPLPLHIPGRTDRGELPGVVDRLEGVIKKLAQHPSLWRHFFSHSCTIAKPNRELTLRSPFAITLVRCVTGNTWLFC